MPGIAIPMVRGMIVAEVLKTPFFTQSYSNTIVLGKGCYVSSLTGLQVI